MLFIIFAFFAYSAVSIPLQEKAIKFFLGAFSAIFSGLVTVALTIPFSSGSSGIIVLTAPYIGDLGAIIAYVVFVVVLTYTIYFLLIKTIRLSFEKMTPS